MAKATYWQRGETLDYTNSTGAVIEANTIVSMVSRIGVVGCNINPGEKGSLHVVGVYEMPKTGSGSIAMGTPVYWDGTGITDTSSDNVPAGIAAATAEASDTKILVRLQG